MTPEDKSLIQILAFGVILNILWLFGLLAALVKIIQ